MQEIARRWHTRLGAHWNKGGGPTAARLWWLAFALATFYGLVGSHLDTHRHHRRMVEVTSLSNLKRIGFGLQAYRKHHNTLPPLNDFADIHRALDRYLGIEYNIDGVEELWRTPELQAVNPSLSLRPWKTYPHPERVIVVWDTRLWRGGRRNVLFVDGKVKSISVAKWNRLRAASGVVREVPALPEPRDWCDTYLPEESTWSAINTVLVGAGLAIFFAAWHDAWQWACSRKRFWLRFAWWFCVRLLGYGFVVMLAAGMIGLVMGSCVVPA